MNEGQLYRLRNWKRVKVFQKQQQQAAQQPIVQNDGEEVIVGNGQTRLSNVISSLRKFAVSIPQAVVSKSQLLGTTISQRFMEITRPAPRRGRSQSRAGVSIGVYMPLPQAAVLHKREWFSYCIHADYEWFS